MITHLFFQLRNILVYACIFSSPFISLLFVLDTQYYILLGQLLHIIFPQSRGITISNFLTVANDYGFDFFVLALPIILIAFLVSWFLRSFSVSRILMFMMPLGAFLLLGYWFIYWSHLIYIGVFETHFRFAIFGFGLQSFQQELIQSIRAEISRQDWINLWQGWFAIGVLVLLSWTIYLFLSKRRWLMLCFAFFLFTASFYHRMQFSGGWNSDQVQLSSDFWQQEMLRNPIILLIWPFVESDPMKKYPNIHNSGEMYAEISADRKLDEPFSFGLNTDSLSEKTVFVRKNVPRGKRYNIVYYFFESTSANYIYDEFQGQSIAPNWQKLIKNSFVAENHYAHNPLTVNAFYSTLASSYEPPSKEFITYLHPDIKQESVLEILKSYGYRTGVIHSGRLRNFAHLAYLKHRQVDFLMDFETMDKHSFKDPQNWCTDDRAMLKPALDFMKQDNEQPFFLSIFPVVPHHPYFIPESKFALTFSAQKKAKTQKEKRWLRYQNALFFGDYVLGRFVQEMTNAGLDKNTIIFIFADHGEAFYQHRGNYLHALYLYEENVRVPFIIYNKELFPKPIHYEGISRHIDIAVTTLDLLGIPKKKVHEGKSLLSAHRRQMALLHTRWDQDIQGIRDGRYKYIWYRQRNFEELFDLAIDPHEKKNIASKHKDLCIQYQNYLHRARDYQYDYFYNLTKHARWQKKR